MTVATEHLTEAELIQQLEEASQKVEVGALYAHYRSPESCYRVIRLALLEATQEVCVVYAKEMGSSVLQSVTWVRALHSWLETVETSQGDVPRFQKIP